MRQADNKGEAKEVEAVVEDVDSSPVLKLGVGAGAGAARAVCKMGVGDAEDVVVDAGAEVVGEKTMSYSR